MLMKLITFLLVTVAGMSAGVCECMLHATCQSARFVNVHTQLELGSFRVRIRVKVRVSVGDRFRYKIYKLCMHYLEIEQIDKSRATCRCYVRFVNKIMGQL